MTSLQQMTLRASAQTVMLCNRMHPAQLQHYHPSGHILEDQEGHISLGVFLAGHRYQTGQTLQMTCWQADLKTAQDLCMAFLSV